MIMMISKLCINAKNPWGVNGLFWEVNWGFWGATMLWSMGYIGGQWGPPEIGGRLGSIGLSLLPFPLDRG